ncbi:hypothetical protein QLX67_09325 [Balneolaceae bacterium ANBcel3]|nr:hypothetical protein [Balneolaceae bacterium ANBcel3]
MNSMIETVEGFIRRAQETWEDEACQERVEELKDRAKTFIREHPAGAVGIAVVAGYILGKLTQKGK